MNNLIEDRNERTRKRKRNKRRMDDLIGLSYHDKDKKVIGLSVLADTVGLAEDAMQLSEDAMQMKTKTIRLLDEGYFDQGFVIKKGTIEKYLDGRNEKIREVVMSEDGTWEYGRVMNLTDDFVGHVNLGHMDFASFPFIIGEWTKEDLSLSDIGNDRVGLDVRLNLDKDSIFVRELKRQPYDIGVSAEFYYAVNSEDTESLSEMLGEYTPVIDEIFIFAYGLVGECGNVNSSGLELSGGNKMEDNKLNEEVLEEEFQSEEIQEEAPETMEEAIEEEPADEEVIEDEFVDDEQDTIEEVATDPEHEEVIEESAEEAPVGEEAEVEEADMSISDEDDGDEAELETVLSLVTDLRNEVKKLTETVESLEEANCELKKTNKRLSNKLKDEKRKKEAFIESAKGISVKLNVCEKPEKENIADSSFAFGDGIGD